MHKLIYHTGDVKKLAEIIKECVNIKYADTYKKLVNSGKKIYNQIFTPAVFERNIMQEISLASKQMI